MSKKVKSRKATQSVILLDQALPEIPNRNDWEIPSSYLEKDGKGGYKIHSVRRPSKTLLVGKIRNEVDDWRASGYPGSSETSRTLLSFWFDQDHLVDKELFRFRFAQREAIETVIYLYEVKNCRDNAVLVENYISEAAFGNEMFHTKSQALKDLRKSRILHRRNPTNDKDVQQELPPKDLTRYCSKAATGSGKTFAMAFLAVWSYFHRKFESSSPLSKTFLIIAPNVIVYERLKSDFSGGQVFAKFPFVPSEWQHHWQMSFIMRDDQVKTSTDGTLYLTNIHQIYESRLEDEDEDLGPVGNLLGRPPKKDSQASWLTTLLERIMAHDELIVINDEAHHVHDEDLVWFKSIMMLHENLKKRRKPGISLMFDLTATPKDENGTFFPWIITDYPLAQAVEDRIVKTPLIVHQSDKSSPDNKKITNAFSNYSEWIHIALARYAEHAKMYGALKQKPVLFIMCEDTRQADDVADGLKKIQGYNKKDQVLVIHTKKDGNLATDQKSLEELREQARLIDDPKSPVKIVVSVLMLREGWDVKNVSIILGLRPFTSKSNILPEQSVGRGLRLMQRIGPEYTQILEIIGTDKFEEFVKQLEEEGVGVGVTRKAPSLGWSIYPIKTRTAFNIELPVLSASFTRKLEGIGNFDPATLKPLGELDERGNLREKDVALVHGIVEKKLGTKQVVIEDDEFISSHELLTSITNKVIKEGRFSGKFNQLYKIVKQYVQHTCFLKEVNLDSMAVRRTLAKSEVSSKLVQLISRALGEQTKVSTEMKMHNYPISLIELDGFFWKRDVAECKRTVFNYTPVFNNLEKDFALFLDKAEDIERFAKLSESYTLFSITYLNKKGSQSLYYPDFVAVQKTKDGTSVHWIIETKGYEDENVPFKDEETRNWCKNASKYTGQEWRYLKVPDRLFRESIQGVKTLEAAVRLVQSQAKLAM